MKNEPKLEWERRNRYHRNMFFFVWLPLLGLTFWWAWETVAPAFQ